MMVPPDPNNPIFIEAKECAFATPELRLRQFVWDLLISGHAAMHNGTVVRLAEPLFPTLLPISPDYLRQFGPRE